MIEEVEEWSDMDSHNGLMCFGFNLGSGAECLHAYDLCREENVYFATDTYISRNAKHIFIPCQAATFRYPIEITTYMHSTCASIAARASAERHQTLHRDQQD